MSFKFHGQNVSLLGYHCLVNIAQKNNTSGLTLVSTDPRKWRIKPDGYMGIVEQVGSRCELVQPGDKVVVERWEVKQADVDDERIIADESQILIVQRKYDGKWGSETPTPGVVVMRLFSQAPKTQLVLPPGVEERQRRRVLYYMGRVTDSGSTQAKEGDILWVERRDRHQFRTPDGRLIFLNCQDSWGQYPIVMKGEKVGKPLEVLK